MITENREKIQRTIISDCETYLSQTRGIPYREYRKSWNSSGNMLEQHPHPLQLNIELTSYCNLRCKMCYYNFIENKTREFMPLELVNQIAKEAKELHIESLWLGAYSECLLHPNISEVIEKFAETAPLDYWLATNGMLLTEKIARTIVDIPITWLTVSLDATTPETYKIIRGGNLDVVEKNIFNFLNVRAQKNSRLPFLRVSFVDMEENHNELELFKQKWGRVADVIDVQTLVDFSKDVTDEPIDESFICIDPYRLLSVKYNGEFLPCCNAAYKNSTQRFYFQNMSIKQFWESTFHQNLIESLHSKQYMPCCAECVRRFRKV